MVSHMDSGSESHGAVSLRERTRVRTREEIAAAALDLMEDQGYEATTVDQIARRAGVSNATFFRYFSSKEEVLFAGERIAEDLAVRLLADRADPAHSLLALMDPVSEMAAAVVADTGSMAHKLTRLVMTTRSLEGRSMRMRLRWERSMARQLARERGLSTPQTEDVLLANLAVACLAAALWSWQRQDSPSAIAAETRDVFRRAIRICAG